MACVDLEEFCKYKESNNDEKSGEKIEKND